MLFHQRISNQSNTLKLQALKFYFCAFCAFLRPYQNLNSQNLIIFYSRFFWIKYQDRNWKNPKIFLKLGTNFHISLRKISATKALSHKGDKVQRSKVQSRTCRRFRSGVVVFLLLISLVGYQIVDETSNVRASASNMVVYILKLSIRNVLLI